MLYPLLALSFRPACLDEPMRHWAAAGCPACSGCHLSLVQKHASAPCYSFFSSHLLTASHHQVNYELSCAQNVSVLCRAWQKQHSINRDDGSLLKCMPSAQTCNLKIPGIWNTRRGALGQVVTCHTTPHQFLKPTFHKAFIQIIFQSSPLISSRYM